MESVGKWLGDNAGWLGGLASLTIVTTFLLTYGAPVRRRLWQGLRTGLRFLRSLPGRFPLRVVKVSTLDALRRESAELRRLAPQQTYKAHIQIVQTPDTPMTLRQRCERTMGEIESEVGRRDRLPGPERRSIGNEYTSFLADLDQLSSDLWHGGREDAATDLRRVTGAQLDRANVLLAAAILRSIDWSKS